MALITGRVELYVNGNMLFNKEGAVAGGLGISGKPNYELAEVMGDSGLHGFIEKPVLAYCEVTITDTNELMLSDIASIRENGTIVFKAASGAKVYTMNNATCTRNLELTAGEGAVKLRFVAPYWIEDIP
jgi:hypothetical protein